MRGFQLAFAAFIFCGATSCIVFHSSVSQPTSPSCMIRDYAAARFGVPFTPIEPERVKYLPRNFIIAFRADEEVEFEQLVKHQRQFSRAGFSTFAIMDNKCVPTPVFFHGFAEKPIVGNNECYTFLMTTNTLVHLAEFRTGIGENEIPPRSGKPLTTTINDLNENTPVEVVCQGNVHLRSFLEGLKKINPDGVRDVYLLHY